MEINRENESLLPYELAQKLFFVMDGKVYWREPGPSRRLDRPAGHNHCGAQEVELQLNECKRKYQGRRIAYLLTHGQWPKHHLTRAKND